MKTTGIYRIVIFLLLCSNFSYGQIKTSLPPAAFEAGIISADSVQLLDVRTPAEYKSGHIKNALLADWKDETEFMRRIGFIDKHKPVYIYCLAGSRSAAAAEKMRAMGYSNVYELKGGINAWKADKKIIEGRADEKQMSAEEFNTSINSAKTILVDFGAEWCPPCKKMEPVLKSLQTKYADKFKLVKVDGGRDEDILKQYQVTALPVFILFKNGKQVWRKEGVVEEKEIADLIR